MSVDTNFILSVFRSEYHKRLNEVIGEVDAVDDDGKVILSPDLKVRHKDSGFEYTIDRIEDEPSGVMIYLRSPEDPRFEPPEEEAELLGEPRTTDILGEQDPPAPALSDVTDQEEVDDEVVFVIDQEEFEKEYEVD